MMLENTFLKLFLNMVIDDLMPVNSIVFFFNTNNFNNKRMFAQNSVI